MHRFRPYEGTDAPEDAGIAVRNGWQQLDAGFFPARWNRVTKKERVSMQAMAVDGDEWSSTNEVAARQEVKIVSLGPTRAQLISEGLIRSPGYGKVAFTAPDMSGFINGQHEE